MKVFKVRPVNGGPWLIGEGADWIQYTLADMSPGDDLEIECVEMSQEELDNLPEHGGW